MSAQTAAGAGHRTRLILKDGSYQIVMSYQVNGNVVRYTSAERDATEEVPAELVDWDATHKWERQHPAADESDAGQGLAVAPAPAIDPELLKEEADRRGVDAGGSAGPAAAGAGQRAGAGHFHGAPELVPLVQSEGELNRTTGHNILKLAINPRSASHQIEQLKGVEAAVQLHVDDAGDLCAAGRRLGGDAGRDSADGGHAWGRIGGEDGFERRLARQRVCDGAGGCAHGRAGAGQLQHRSAGRRR